MKQTNILILVFALSSIATNAIAASDCKSVKGRVTSTVVEFFSSGEACTSPLGICSEGRFTGKAKGSFTFIADSLVPYSVQDPNAQADVAATTGRLELTPKKLCDGTILFRDTSAFALAPDGSFVSIGTVDPAASSGSCAETSGRIRIEGIFMGGCVDCRYGGERCGLGGDDDDEDDDD